MHKQKIIFTCLVALILTIIPLPLWLIQISPLWVLLVLMAWLLEAPQQVGLGVALVMGIALDLLQGTLLGEHALALIMVAIVVSHLRARLRMFPLLQQGLCVFCFALLYLFIIYTIQGMMDGLPDHLFLLYWVAAMTSLLIWPWVIACIRQ